MKFLGGGRSRGFAIPLLSLRTEQGPCGEYPDIARLADLASQWGMNLLQILPVNDTGFQTSPYSALSAFALNPIYLRLSDLPELADPEALGEAGGPLLERAARLAASAGTSKKVPYEAILREKLSILSAVWKAARATRSANKLDKAIDAWAEAQPWVVPYSVFMELKNRYMGSPWWEWPEYRNPREDDIAGLWHSGDIGPNARFRAWIQMRAAAQFELSCRHAANAGVDLMGDIPILLNLDSADIWHRRELFDVDSRAGAPPDMYSALGQNWGFPLYRWDRLEQEGFSFWKERLGFADRFYSAYRIDHVLGFFRIWAIGSAEADGFLGRFVPGFPVEYHELAALGLDDGRIRWLSVPHVSGDELAQALAPLPEALRGAAAESLFRRIGSEQLFLFEPGIRGGADIAARLRELDGGSPDAPELAECVSRLQARWRDRALLEYEPGRFSLTWEYGATKSWRSLSDDERARLEAIFSRRRAESMAVWERKGEAILRAVTGGVAMKAFAEDLGAVPPFVPEVLERLGIPGLRVLRWHRRWGEPGNPYIPLSEYPSETLACLSVHDSSNLREWWRDEADRTEVWEVLGETPPEAPADLPPDDTLRLFKGFSKVNSRYVCHPIQDILAADDNLRELRPEDERVNVPGTMNGSNWLYRTKPSLEQLLSDKELARKLRALG